MYLKILITIISIIVSSKLFLTPLVETSEHFGSRKIDSTRAELEEQMLKSTVRIQIESWIVRPDESGYDVEHTLGHGTVMAGHYLVTHNHFNVPVSILHRDIDAGSYGVVYLYNSRGKLLYKGPLSDYEIKINDGETLVFAHKDKMFFEKLGFVSASFATWPALELSPGIELAQVDWDGQKARIDWVKVQEVILNDGIPRLVLDDGVLPGASGGGIFLEGKHIANNWQLHEKINGNGEVVEATTTVALNGSVPELQ